MSLSLTDIGYVHARGTTVELRALDGVTLVVEPGELLLVAGETGSGKSTLLRVAAGLLAPGSGEALIDGEPLDASSARGRVGLVFQDAEQQLFADTVADDVAFGPRNLGASAEQVADRVRSALGAVGLDPESHGGRSPFTLSGGEARRAAIAGVLAMEPRYLLVDEPTSGLDSVGRRFVHAAIGSARKHSGVVVVSHSPEEFLDDATQVLLLKGGRTVWRGPSRTLMEDPSPLETANLSVPEVLAVQLASVAQDGLAGPPVLDPDAAARRILAARAHR